RPARRLSPETVHVIDCRTGECLCHTGYMNRLEKIGREIGRQVKGVYEWQLRLSRLEKKFQCGPTITQMVKTVTPLPVPDLGYIEQLGIAGEISPAEAATAAEASAAETFNRAQYERVCNALRHRSHPAAQGEL